LRNAPVATVAFSKGKYVTKIKRLAEKYPDECVIVDENYDGSVVAHIPTKWIKISPPKQVSEEFREMASQRFKEMHESGQLKKQKKKRGK
jgi:hypothetical protein